jgi:hypothetical protein
MAEHPTDGLSTEYIDGEWRTPTDESDPVFKTNCDLVPVTSSDHLMTQISGFYSLTSPPVVARGFPSQPSVALLSATVLPQIGVIR